MNRGPILTVDIGGTKIAAALASPDGTLRPGSMSVRPTPAGADAEQVWAVLSALIDDTARAAGREIGAVGIGWAGPIDVEAGTVSPVNIANWREYPLRERINEMLPGVPLALAGDGLCMALGEHRHGAGRGSASLLGMVVSTGIGGGLVLDGIAYRGRTGNAGHVGHVVVEHGDGPPCRCGGRGCVETIASGPSMVRWALAHGWRPTVRADAPPDARLLANAVRDGDPAAAAAFDRGAAALGAMIASVAAVCDLDLVVIGGGVAKSGDVLFDRVRSELNRYARLEFLRGLRVVPAELGGQAGLVGSAVLAGDGG